MQSKEAFIKQQGDQLFGSRGSLMYYWQETAANFYPERADFTVNRTLGEDFASDLATGYPCMVRRDLGNAFSGMLRPTNKKWFHIQVEEWDSVSTEARRWLEKAEDRMRKAMYHKDTQFVIAMKQGDHDFAAFGQTVIQLSLNSSASGLLYRCWHLRDVAWTTDTNNAIATVFRKWEPTVAELVRLFPKSCHDEVHTKIKNGHANDKIKVWHAIMPVDVSGPFSKDIKTPFVSVYFDTENNHIMEEVGSKRQEYMIPRWQTVSGSQYAYSPATVVALADARTLQEMTITLLEAGEKATNPPLLGVKGALRSDVNLMAGGLTWVDSEYDERLGEVLRPLTVDKSGLPTGFMMADALQDQLVKAFFLDKLSLPPQDVEMTAFETGKRVEEYIRNALPLFEPMETESNTPVCENTFEMLLENGVFGSPYEVPEELTERNIEFVFESPLHDALERQKGQRLLESASLIANLSGIDPSVRHTLDASTGVRDTLHGSGVPAKWIRSPGEAAELAAAEAKQAQDAAMLEQMKTGSEAAKNIGSIPAPGGIAPEQ